MMGTLVFLGIITGLRISDLLALKVSDVGQAFEVVEQKTRKKKRIMLCDDQWYVLESYIICNHLKPDDRLFPTTRQTVLKYIKRAAADLGIKSPIGTHSMRKSYG